VILFLDRIGEPRLGHGARLVAPFAKELLVDVETPAPLFFVMPQARTLLSGRIIGFWCCFRSTRQPPGPPPFSSDELNYLISK
jgi:hypothetical protein